MNKQINHCAFTDKKAKTSRGLYSKKQTKALLQTKNKENNINKENIPSNTDNNIKSPSFIDTTSKSPINLLNNIHGKVYEIAIDSFFTFIKNKFPCKIYDELKTKFRNEIRKALQLQSKFISNEGNVSFSKYIHCPKSSIFINPNNIITNETTLKLSNEHLSNNIKAKTKTVNKLNEQLLLIPPKKRSHSKGNYHKKSYDKKHSLYTLTKGTLQLIKTHSFSKSKSSPKVHRKHPKINNSINYNIILEPSQLTTTTTCNSTQLFNDKLFKRLSRDLIGSEYPFKKERNTHRLHSKPSFIKNKSKLLLNSGYTINNESCIKVLHNRNSKGNMLCNNNSNYTLSTYHTNANSTKRINDSSKKLILSGKQKTKNKQKVQRFTIQNELDIEAKSTEQLKEIKSNLDDNLKVIFNFSYENFLNKESETPSKKSFNEEEHEQNNQLDNNIYYKKKYQY